MQPVTVRGNLCAQLGALCENQGWELISADGGTGAAVPFFSVMVQMVHALAAGAVRTFDRSSEEVCTSGSPSKVRLAYVFTSLGV